MADTSTRDSKLIQYLNEAYGKEKELETSLQAHIAMTTRAPYKKRLQQHLKETKAHARSVERRIKQLGGKAHAGPGPGPVGDVTAGVQKGASKAVAAAKGPVHAIRGTGESEKMLKNAKTEFSGEFEEIATYSGIEALAEAVGDRDTAKLARDIRREEERMARFLEKEIGRLAKGVAREEIPAAERRRNGGTRRRRSSGARRSTATTRSSARGSASASRPSSRSGSSAGRSSTRSRSSSSTSRSRSK